MIHEIAGLPLDKVHLYFEEFGQILNGDKAVARLHEIADDEKAVEDFRSVYEDLRIMHEIRYQGITDGTACLACRHGNAVRCAVLNREAVPRVWETCHPRFAHGIREAVSEHRIRFSVCAACNTDYENSKKHYWESEYEQHVKEIVEIVDTDFRQNVLHPLLDNIRSQRLHCRWAREDAQASAALAERLAGANPEAWMGLGGDGQAVVKQIFAQVSGELPGQ